MKRFQIILAAAIVILTAFSLLATIGTDTAWGDVEVKHFVLATDTGDEMNMLMYKPKSATAETPAPVVLMGHGGNDMMEQMTSYCIELSRRGYVCITRDATGNHNSDPATPGTEEKVRSGGAGSPSGFDVIFKAVKNFSFVDQDHIVVMGHSLGGTNQLALSLKYQDQIFLSMHVGQNVLGDAENRQHDFNFVGIIGDCDEAVMMNSVPQNDTFYSFQTAQFKRLFTGDYETPDEELENIEIGKVYTVTGTNGKEYHRTAYRPASTHAYYLVTNDAVQTVVYAVTSEVGVGLDEGVTSYADHNKISTVWQWHDIGYFTTYLAVICMMIFMASWLLETNLFKGLIVPGRKEISLSYNRRSWQWWVFAVILFFTPLLMFKQGINLATTKYMGFLEVKSLWLCGGNNNVIVAWQWCCSVIMLALFLIYHFTYGKKKGGSLAAYGFATGESGRICPMYLLKAFGYGLLTVGSGYLLFCLISAYTKQGIHITTFMISTISTKRTLAILMYFLFQIPYFLISGLAFKALGLQEGKSLWKAIGLTALFTVGLMFVYWLWYLLTLTITNGMPAYFYDNTLLLNQLLVSGGKIVVYNMMILPLTICMFTANTLNLYVSKKTKSLWAGFFVALLFGTWMLISCGELTKMVY